MPNGKDKKTDANYSFWSLPKRNKRGQILVELLSMVIVFITFISFSVIIFDSYKKTSYRYLLSEAVND